MRIAIALLLGAWFAIAHARPVLYGQNTDAGDALFTGPVPRLEIEIPPASLETLRAYQQVWRQKRPERVDVPVTVRSGGRVYTNVAIHLKGSYSFQPIDAEPSLTLHFDKFAPGQTFHGLDKIHLNNSAQDPTYLSETLARELFAAHGIPAPRAGPAVVTINGRSAGTYVLVEGANKSWVKRHFASAKGNLYDGGSGGDLAKAMLETDSGAQPENRTEITNLLHALREPDPAKRLARCETILDVDNFITFAALEISLVHWDGYTISANNFRLFHDTARGKLIFIPHGLDQLFGVSSSTAMWITPHFKSTVGKTLFAVPEARERLVNRITELATNELSPAAIHARVDRLAARARTAVPRGETAAFDHAVAAMKQRITQRGASITQQLRHPPEPMQFPNDHPVRLAGWNYKGGPTLAASSLRKMMKGQEHLVVTGRGPGSSGAWRKQILLGPGHYEFTGRARTEGLPAGTATGGTNGVLLRISGERSLDGLSTATEWTPLTYRFDVHGIESIELVGEFRGPAGTGTFDGRAFHLARKGPPLHRAEEP